MKLDLSVVVVVHILEHLRQHVGLDIDREQLEQVGELAVAEEASVLVVYHREELPVQVEPAPFSDGRQHTPCGRDRIQYRNTVLIQYYYSIRSCVCDLPFAVRLGGWAQVSW